MGARGTNSFLLSAAAARGKGQSSKGQAGRYPMDYMRACAPVLSRGGAIVPAQPLRVAVAPRWKRLFAVMRRSCALSKRLQRGQVCGARVAAARVVRPAHERGPSRHAHSVSSRRCVRFADPRRRMPGSKGVAHAGEQGRVQAPAAGEPLRADFCELKSYKVITRYDQTTFFMFTHGTRQITCLGISAVLSSLRRRPVII